MSEYVFWYILMLEKEVLKNLKFQSEKKWSHRAQPSIQNKVLAIMWVGSIWKEIARVWKIFWMEVIGLRTIDEPVEYIDEVYTEDNIKKFLSKADYLVLVLPNTVSTKNMINEETLSYMKKTSVLINVWRWNSINEDDLIQALNNKKISFAVLDVFKEEPLSKENPLWNLDNIIITPHISWYIVDITKIINVFWDNYKKFINWEKVDYRIDFKKWY
jgi:phosphoglycerate dehydrogenase-like enzyme